MAKIDEIKEEIGWLKIWLGIFVVTMFSMIAWLAGNYDKADMLVIFLDVVGILVLAVIISFINKKAIKRIRSLRDIERED
ncbi:MAG: hypothetical protein ACLFQJ_03405 [Campylobacterales bacterium]